MRIHKVNTCIFILVAPYAVISKLFGQLAHATRLSFALILCFYCLVSKRHIAFQGHLENRLNEA